MAVEFSNTNKPINPRGNDASPKGYNRASLFSGKALDFDGVNDYLASDSFSLDTSEWSASMILKNDASPSDKIFFTFASASSADESFIFYNDFANSNKIAFYGAAFTGSPVIFDYVIPTDYEHLTFTFASNTLSLYVNGVFVDSGSVTGNDGTQTANAIVGARKNFSFYNQFFNGQVSGLKMYSTALTAAQVADLYNNPEKIVPTGVDNTALKLYLPMMEGAGTTAYDGSGNGNHGTISGATYTHGIGAPVAQTAVIDWNKGVNLLDEYSEDFSNSGWTKTGSSISASSESNPYGKQTWEFEVTSLPSEVQVRGNISGSTPSSTAFKSFVIAKAGTLDWLRVRNLFVTGGGTSGNVWFNLSTGSVGTEQSGQTGTMTDLGNGWYKCEVSGTTAAAIPNYLFDVGFTDTDNTNEPTATGGTGLLVLSAFSLNGIYVETLGSAQTSDVLLPQGLTTGRDITGVNLFENVRKQGALNLDGNSWAEVHDNESLDISPAMTMEVWIKCGDELNSVYDHIFVKPTSASWSSPYGTYVLRLNNSGIQWWFDSVSNAAGHSVVLTGWNHLAITKNGTAEILYLNGVQVDTFSGAATISLTAFDLIIGTLTSKAPSESVANQLAQPRIYNRALTAAEVLQNYNSGKNTYK